MSYEKTDWTNNITPINQSNMNKIENELWLLENTISSLQTELINKNTYSTSETICGKWIDGKNIYRKVYIPFEAKSYTATTYTISVDSGIDKIIRWDVLTTGNSNNNQEVNKYINRGRYTKSTNSLTLECGTTYSTQITHIILEYTKI